MPDIKLPLTATVSEISEAISRIQARARTALADPDVLARRVREQLDLVERAAGAVGRPLADLSPSGCFLSPGDPMATRTRVHVSWYGLQVDRGGTPSTTDDGSLHLTLYPPGKRPWWLQERLVDSLTDLEPGEQVPMTGVSDG